MHTLTKLVLLTFSPPVYSHHHFEDMRVHIMSILPIHFIKLSSDTHWNANFFHTKL